LDDLLPLLGRNRADLLRGGTILARSTIPGLPSSSSMETSASPTPSSVITVSTFSFGF
jgi:hypothetical protein